MAKQDNTVWRHNTLEAVELARIDVQAAQDALEQAREHLQEALSIHHGSNAAERIIDEQGLGWDDAVEEMHDEVADYALAEAILRHDRPELESAETTCAFSGESIEDGDGWSVADERRYQAEAERIEEV
jgi:hypothetical protein